MRHSHTRQQVNALVALVGDIDTAAKVLTLLSLEAARWHLQKSDRAEYATRLRRAGVSRAEVVNRLMQRFGVSQKTAYRLVNETLSINTAI